MISDKNEIIKRFINSDAAAFDEIYHKYSNKIYSFAYGLLKDHDLAIDLVQDVFVTLWNKRHHVDARLVFENYIFTITYNAIRKHFRKKNVEFKVKDYLLKNSPEVLENTDSSLIFEELLQLANKTIEKLPAKRKKVYKLSRQEDLSIKEIAGRLNISTRTAENHLAKALKFLKEELTSISLPALLFFNLFLG